MQYQKIDGKLIGKGGYSMVYLCKKKNCESNKRYAMKISEEYNNPLKDHLLIEYKILKFLSGGIGIPKVYYFGKENKDTNNFCLVQELLGNNLNQELKRYKNKFPKELYIKIALQMISRIQFLHSLGFIHCDIKPDNFAFSIENDKKNFIIYLIDFGLAEPYINLITKEHRHLEEEKGHRGTMNFCSMNSHMGLSLSRRDDLESLAYCLIYLWIGKLPWIIHNHNDNLNDEILNSKIEFSSYICSNNKNIPKNLKIFLDYVIKLKFEELPNYKYLKDLIRGI